MAVARKKPKPKPKQNKIPKSGAQKGAESALQASQRIALEAQRSRTAQSSRGAFKARQLRAGGTSLQQYDLAKFKSDPFPALGGGGYSGGGQSGGGSPGGGGKTPKAATSGASSIDGKKGVKQQQEAKAKNRRKDNMNSPNITELMQEKAALKAKQKAAAAAAAAKAKKKKQTKLTDAKGGTVKALGTKVTMS